MPPGRFFRDDRPGEFPAGMGPDPVDITDSVNSAPYRNRPGLFFVRHRSLAPPAAGMLVRIFLGAVSPGSGKMGPRIDGQGRFTARLPMTLPETHRIHGQTPHAQAEQVAQDCSPARILSVTNFHARSS